MRQVERELELDPSRFKGDDRPVEKITWYDAVEFCARLSQHTGRDYRLPTEAEWEYACRGGTTTPFHFGETITSDLVNYQGTQTYGAGPAGEDRKQTTDVGSFLANAFGLYDMHGNVWEWCQDHWHDNYTGAPIDGTAWLSSGESKSRVLRGGSWGFYPAGCRSANRVRYAPGFTDYDVGFRVVCGDART
jgi:formylglycine-generating enzyme required for sulfatase activity